MQILSVRAIAHIRMQLRVAQNSVMKLNVEYSDTSGIAYDNLF